jgi:MFS transporter, DHA2 family, methylenomycin A resistance protein
VGLWAAGASLALTAGPLLGGVLTTLAGWRSLRGLNWISAATSRPLNYHMKRHVRSDPPRSLRWSVTDGARTRSGEAPRIV